jgi:predicted negative regulator of RcsB-dependent stress response
MSASQFRLFLAAVVVLGIVGWIGWQTMQSRARIKDCMASYLETAERCAAADRAGKLRRG